MVWREPLESINDALRMLLNIAQRHQQNQVCFSGMRMLGDRFPSNVISDRGEFQWYKVYLNLPIGDVVILALRQVEQQLKSGALVTIDRSRLRVRILPIG